jgi:hypothetical protein
MRLKAIKSATHDEKQMIQLLYFLLISRVEIMHKTTHEFKNMPSHRTTQRMRIRHDPKENSLGAPSLLH